MNDPETDVAEHLEVLTDDDMLEELCLRSHPLEPAVVEAALNETLAQCSGDLEQAQTVLDSRRSEALAKGLEQIAATGEAIARAVMVHEACLEKLEEQLPTDPAPDP